MSHNSSDQDLQNLNPGIRQVVAWLRDHGYKTIDSGDGTTHEYACDRQEAYVVMEVEPPADLVLQAYRLMEILRDIGVELHTFGPEGPTGVSLDASYHLPQGIALIDLMNFNDDDLAVAVADRRMQHELG